MTLSMRASSAITIDAKYSGALPLHHENQAADARLDQARPRGYGNVRDELVGDHSCETAPRCGSADCALLYPPYGS